MKSLILPTVGFWLLALIIPLTTQAQATGEYSVAVSQSSYEAGESISIDWTAPENEVTPTDWIGLYKITSTDRSPEEWKYIDGATTEGSLELTENTTGTYEIRMFKNNTYTLVATSEEFEIVDQNNVVIANNNNGGGGGGGTGTYDLTLSDTSIEVGDSVTVSWNVPAGTTITKDWVGLYKVGASDRKPEDWEYTNGRTGSVTFVIDSAGQYEVRYLKNNRYTAVKVSETITVTGTGGGGGGTGGGGGGGGTGTYDLTLSDTSIEVGDSVTVSWNVPAGTTITKDWVGLYKVGASDRKPEDWEYTNGRTGSVTFVIDSAGQYEVRYLKNNRYTAVKVSETITVTGTGGGGGGTGGGGGGGGTGTYDLTLSDTSIEVGDSVTVSWNVPAGTTITKDWVGLYKVGASDRKPEDWEYTNGRTGSVTFVIDSAGQYEVRYLKNNRYTAVKVSETITVTGTGGGGGGTGGGGGGGGTGTYDLTLSDTSIEVGDSVTVSWNVPAGTTITKDWVGLYKVGASDRKPEDWEYTNGRTGSVTFVIDSAGQYEVRYLKNNRYTAVKVSETITVTGTGGGGGGTGGGGGGGGTGTYDLTLSDTSIEVGDSVTVSWNVPAGTTITKDWVGLYKVGASDRKPEDWEYTNGRTGSVTFVIDSAGQYEVRYLKNNRYTAVKVSETITVTGTGGGGGNQTYSVISNKSSYLVGETAAATWGWPSSNFLSLNWIGLYPIGAADNAYIDFEYTDILSYTEYFPLTRTGTFEFRFFINNSYTKVATSQPFTVNINTTGGSCNGYDLAEVTNYPSKNGPVIALGDSLTYGTGATANQNYVDELEKRLNIDVINAGVPSDTTRNILSRLNRDVLSKNPSTVIVLAGGNDELRRIYASLSDSVSDQARKVQLDTYVRERFGYEWEDVPLISRSESLANIRAIIDQIQSTGANTVLVGFDNIFVADSLYDGYEDIAEDTGSIFIPNVYDDVFGRPSLMSDLVHPNNAGYDIFADRIQLGLECLI